MPYILLPLRARKEGRRGKLAVRSCRIDAYGFLIVRFNDGTLCMVTMHKPLRYAFKDMES